MHFVGWNQAVSAVTLATRALATGYTLAPGAAAEASFAQAIGVPFNAGAVMIIRPRIGRDAAHTEREGRSGIR